MSEKPNIDLEALETLEKSKNEILERVAAEPRQLMFSKFDKVKFAHCRLRGMINSILGNTALRVVIIVISTCVTTLLVSGYFVYDRLLSSADLVKKIDSLQIG